jgi:hypothetical protein
MFKPESSDVVGRGLLGIPNIPLDVVKRQKLAAVD